MARFRTLLAEILIAQSGLSMTKRTRDKNMVLAAAVTYLKDTIDCDWKSAAAADWKRSWRIPYIGEEPLDVSIHHDCIFRMSQMLQSSQSDY